MTTHGEVKPVVQQRPGAQILQAHLDIKQRHDWTSYGLSLRWVLYLCFVLVWALISLLSVVLHTCAPLL